MLADCQPLAHFFFFFPFLPSLPALPSQRCLLITAFVVLHASLKGEYPQRCVAKCAATVVYIRKDNEMKNNLLIIMSSAAKPAVTAAPPIVEPGSWEDFAFPEKSPEAWMACFQRACLEQFRKTTKEREKEAHMLRFLSHSLSTGHCKERWEARMCRLCVSIELDLRILSQM